MTQVIRDTNPGRALAAMRKLVDKPCACGCGQIMYQVRTTQRFLSKAHAMRYQRRKHGTVAQK